MVKSIDGCPVIIELTDDGYVAGRADNWSRVPNAGELIQANLDLIERVKARVVGLLVEQGRIPGTTADGAAIVPGMRLYRLDKGGVREATWPLEVGGVYYKSKQVAVINYAIELLKGVK